MKRIDDMAGRLPPLYREGDLVTALLAQPALQVEIIGEYLLDIQRAHHFDSALEPDDAARLAALLDQTPESWQGLALFRGWVHAQRDAALAHGAVTVKAIQGFVESYTGAYQSALNVRFHGAAPELEEYPKRHCVMRPMLTDGLTPLSQFTIVNRGLDETWASFLLTGLPTAPECMPVVANLTTGEALVYAGKIRPGERVWLRAEQGGGLTGRHERREVTERLSSIVPLTPGEAWTGAQVQTPARALRLARGENRLWFLPVAHYDEPGLDRFLLALADLDLTQGRWDEARLDHTVFFQDAAVNMTASWFETRPATFEVRLPGQSVRSHALAAMSATDHREQLQQAMETGVQRLKAVGIRSEVRLLNFREIQPQTDFITGVLPLRLKEAGSSGADRLPDVGGLFSVTGFGDSTYR